MVSMHLYTVKCDRIQELNQRLSQSHTSEEIKSIVEQQVTIIKEEKSATVTPSVLSPIDLLNYDDICNRGEC